MGDYVIAHEEVHFNPRSREGSDELRLFFYSWLNQFQSTLPRRERLYKVVHEYCNDDFNPRSREGSDDVGVGCVYQTDDFNPRSREGSDIKLFQHSNVLDYFNPRSREGSDYTRAASAKHSDYFNPRSREGSDDAEVEAVNSAKISIHAPAKGATKPRGACLFPKRFQSTLPRRERPVEGRRRESAG